MVGAARDRVRTEKILRDAEALIARLRGVALDDAAQALKDHATLMRVPVVDVARAVTAGLATVESVRGTRQSGTPDDHPAS